MLRALLSRQIRAMERSFDYDAGYMHDVLAVSPWTLLKFSFVTSLGRGRHAPPEALAAAGIVGTLVGDCGPCTQISIDIAARNGVSPDVLCAVLAGDETAMGETAALAYRFARASLARDMATADPLRDDIVRRWGHAGLVDIAMSLTTAQMYPTLKYALGHGMTCSRVTVAGEVAPFLLPPLYGEGQDAKHPEWGAAGKPQPPEAAAAPHSDRFAICPSP
jgi:hypothetical protein